MDIITIYEGFKHFFTKAMPEAKQKIIFFTKLLQLILRYVKIKLNFDIICLKGGNYE